MLTGSTCYTLNSRYSVLSVSIDVVNTRCYCPLLDTVVLDPGDLVHHLSEVVGVAILTITHNTDLVQLNCL